MYNKTEIFKNAWKMVKELGYTLSKALKAAWNAAKNPVKEYVMETVIKSAKVWEKGGHVRVYLTLDRVSEYQHKKGIYVDVVAKTASHTLEYVIGFRKEEEINAVIAYACKVAGVKA